MKKTSIKRICAIIIMFCSVFALTLSFATVSNNMGYSSKTNKVVPTKWEVKFDNLSKPQLVGSAKVASEPTLIATNVSGYSIVLTKPGDSVTYTFDVINGGNVNAVVKSLTKLNAICNSGVDTPSSTVVCGNLVYKLNYTGGEEVKEGDILKANETKNLTLTVGYNKDAKQLPTSSVTIKNLDVTVLYAQAE